MPFAAGASGPKSGVGILGVGKYIPNRRIGNDLIQEWSGVSARTIVDKTGIKSRYIVEEDESASDMSFHAANEAIRDAGIDPKQLSQIIVCSFSGDYVYPAMAAKIQAMLGAANAGTFDILANCTSFQIGLGAIADRFRCDPSLEYGLVIGTALQSRYINWSDPEMAFYFGDGAGAAVVGRVPEDYGILSTAISTNGKAYESVRLRGGGSSYRETSNTNDKKSLYYEMNGLEVWKQVIQYQPKIIKSALDKIGKNIEEIDYVILHQANLRLIEYFMGKMKLPMSKTTTNIESYGNTADASQAIALYDAVKNNALKQGDLVVISGVGAGFIFGASTIRWY